MDASKNLKALQIAILIFSLIFITSTSAAVAPQNFEDTFTGYSWDTPSLENACDYELSSRYSVADWNDWEALWSQKSESEFKEAMRENGMPGRGDSRLTKRNGNRYSCTDCVNSGEDRQYTLTRWNHDKPSYYAAHDDIDNHLLSLGSWHYDNRPVMCISSLPECPTGGDAVVSNTCSLDPGKYSYSSLTVESGATMILNTDPGACDMSARGSGCDPGLYTNYGVKIVSSGQIQVDGTITSSEKGHLMPKNKGGLGGPGSGDGGNKVNGAGGYGGAGGDGDTGASGGPTYGNEQVAKRLGSAGGWDTDGSLNGGRGGGTVWIQADNDITIEGAIRADGQDSSGGAGGGSGGSIRINTSSLIQGSGTVSADGGDNSNRGGAGGGGRIVLLDSDGGSNPITTDVEGGSTTSLNGDGERGTVYTDSTSSGALRPINPDPKHREIIRNDPPVRISAKYRSPSLDGDLIFQDEEDGSEIGRCGPVSGGERCGVDWNDYEHGENNWSAIAEDEIGLRTQSDIWTLIKNQRPQVDSLVRPDDTTVNGNGTVLKAEVSDPNSGDPLTVTFINNKTGAEIGTDTVTGSGTAQVTWSQADLNRGENHWWHVNVSDPWEFDVSDENASFYVNELPTIKDINPPDEGLSSDSPTSLEVEVEDDLSSELDVYFYDNDGSVFLGNDTVNNGGTARYNWTDLDIGNEYEWFVNVSDGRENLTVNNIDSSKTPSMPPWIFDKVTSADFRPGIRPEIDYSSIIIGKRSSFQFVFTVENNVEERKTLNTSLTGVKAEFADNNRFWKEYELEEFGEKRFQVRLDPKTSGKKNLNITASNDVLGIKTTEQVPVHVKNRSRITQEEDVPGIGFLNLVVMMLTAGALYWISL